MNATAPNMSGTPSGHRQLRTHDDEYISALAFSPVDPALGWLITNYGTLFKSEDNAETWTKVNLPELGGHYFYGHAILPSKTDRETITIGGSGYSNPGVYRSTDGGESWVNWSQGLPATLIYSLGEPNDGSGWVFAGTETAAYMRAPEDSQWQDITTNEAPVTIYWSVEALHHENTMRFGTYGRGIWDYRLEGDDSCSDDLDQDGYTCDVDCDDNDASIQLQCFNKKTWSHGYYGQRSIVEEGADKTAMEPSTVRNLWGCACSASATTPWMIYGPSLFSD